MTAPLAFAHLALSVTDLDRSVAWYQRLLGTDPLPRVEDPTFSWVAWLEPSFALHQHHHTLADAPFDERRPGLDHLAFACTDRSELEAWSTKLDDLGIPHSPIVDAFYGHALAFRDPDGTALELFAPA